MQCVSHRYKNELQVFNDIETLYWLTSDRHPNPLLPVEVDESCSSLVALFRQYGDMECPVRYKRRTTRFLDLTGFDANNVILCYSGGKDSTAAVFKLREQGYNVYLYHLKGANRFYYDEWQAAEKLAKELDCSLYFDEMHYSGYHEWIEHPMKNMLLANAALCYGIREGIGTKIAFGNFSNSTLEVDPFDVCGGDCKEMWSAYNHIIQTVIPGFEVMLPLVNMQDTLDTLPPELIPLTQSCMTPNRFRESLRQKNLAKYGEPTLEHRCGSCWKCAVEYIWMADNGLAEYNEDYYNHCFETLRNTMKKETGVRYVSDEAVWNNYFFYEFKKKPFTTG